MYKNTTQHGNADCLSRLPMETQNADRNLKNKQKDSSEIFNLSQIEILPVPMEKIEQETRRDPILSEVYEWTRQGWPNQAPAQLREFQSRCHELTIRTWTMHYVGYQSGDSTEVSEACFGRVASGAHWGGEDESTGTKLCMVAWH